ncbi:hypothetical protein NN561_014566 [Cricetulus griseus]
MDGSCRNSLPGARTPGRSGATSPASRLCSCTFFIRRILKRRRRSVGVDELDHTALPSGAPCGSGTCRAGSCRFSIMLAAGIGVPGRCPVPSTCSLARGSPSRLSTPGRVALSTLTFSKELEPASKIKFLFLERREEGTGGDAASCGLELFEERFLAQSAAGEATPDVVTVACQASPPDCPPGAPLARPRVCLPLRSLALLVSLP